MPSENDFFIREAKAEDAPLILEFIKNLAAYEKMSDQVVATVETLREWIFEKKTAKVIFGVHNGKEVAFALYFNNFSTFLGRAGLYLEDLFVLEEYRGMGFGKAMLRQLAKIAADEGLGRFEWVCLNWNQPSLDFYRSIGAKTQPDWIIHRLSGKDLEDFSSEKL